MLNIILSSIVIFIHLYIFSCVYCSKIFVWWNDLFGYNQFLNYVPIIFSGFLILYIFQLLGVIKDQRLYRSIRLTVLFFCLMNILYWSLVVFSLGEILLQYIVLILIHLTLLVRIVTPAIGSIASSTTDR